MIEWDDEQDSQYVSRYLLYQLIKVEYQRSGGYFQPLPILKWKWEKITMNFVTVLTRNSEGNILYGLY